MIHADAGASEVRAYPVKEAGAGYTGRMESILKATNDPLFRPVDVAVAPDGSLFIADWYDPGVGGHNVGDQTHGRIMRVAPTGVPYRVGKAPDLSSPEQAVTAERAAVVTLLNRFERHPHAINVIGSILKWRAGEPDPVANLSAELEQMGIDELDDLFEAVLSGRLARPGPH